MRRLILTVLFTASTTVAHAGGFYVPEVGARATAMGGAATAAQSDASAIVHNPAAIAGQPGTSVQLGAALVFPKINFFRRPVDDPSTGQRVEFEGASNTNSVGAVPYLAAISNALHPDLSIGLGVYAPFAAALDLPEDGAQRHVATALHLTTIFVGPAVAYRIDEHLSVGVSASYVFGEIEIAQKNAIQFVTGDPEQFPDPDPAVEGTTAITAHDSFGIAVKAGLHYATQHFSLGLSVLVPPKLVLEGEATVSNPGITELRDDDGNTVMAAGARRDNVRLEIPLPIIVGLGAAVRPTHGLTIALDATYQGWSRFDTLTVDFRSQPVLLPTPGAFLYDVVAENAWHDTVSVRLGAEYVLDVVPLALRAGVFYDQSPIDDAHFDLLAPDSDKLGVGLGGSYRIGLGDTFAVDIEVAVLHIAFKERNIEPTTVQVGDRERTSRGSVRTILNKPAPSFFEGVTRARAEIAYVGLSLRI